MGIFSSIGSALGGLIPGVGPALGTAIGGGLGGFLDSKLGAGSTTPYRVNYTRMREDALKAGFNPLTVLQNGGAANYAQGGELTDAAFLHQSFNDAYDNYFDQQSQEKDREMQDLQMEIMRAELDEIQNSSDGAIRRGYGFDIPTVVSHAEEGENEQPQFGQSADSDVVYEIESDAYLAGIKGNLGAWGSELIKRNTPEIFSDWYQQGSDFKDRIEGWKDDFSKHWNSTIEKPAGWTPR